MAPRWSARPARSSRRRCAGWPKPNSVFKQTTSHQLFGGLLQRRDAGQDDLDSRAAARLGIKIEAGAQPGGHDAVDDMQTEPGAALIAARREERIERAAPDIE